MGILEEDLKQRATQLDEPDEHLIDLSKEYDELTFAIRIGRVGAISLGDIQAIKAKAKQGKTYLVSVFAAAILSGACVGVESDLRDAKVMFFDTEQNPRNTARVARRVHALCGWDIKRNNDRFRAYSLRDMETTERLGYIKGEIERCRPNVIFIDGIRDLLIDFNDQLESTTLVQEMMTLSKDYNMAIVNILHTNKGKDDNNMRGHLGTELVNKSSDVFSVTRTKDGVFNVEQTDCRNMPVDDFAFTLDDDGVPVKADVSKVNPVIEQAASYFREILSEGRAMTRAELAQKFQEDSGSVRSVSYKRIKQALDCGLLMIGKVDGLIRIKP